MGMHAPNASGQAPQRKGGPQAEQRVGHPGTEIPAMEKSNIPEDKFYRWVEGECLKDYSNSAAKWAAHSSTQDFTSAFNAIYTEYAADNNVRTTKIEEFLLKEAETAGVIT